MLRYSFMSVVNILAPCEQGFSRSSERTCHNKLGWNSSKVTQEMLSSCRRCTTSCHENICSKSIRLLSVSRHVCKYNWNGNKNVTFLKVDSCALSFYLLFFCFLVQVLFTFSNVQLYLLECLCGVCVCWWSTSLVAYVRVCSSEQWRMEKVTDKIAHSTDRTIDKRTDMEHTHKWSSSNNFPLFSVRVSMYVCMCTYHVCDRLYVHVKMVHNRGQGKYLQL